MTNKNLFLKISLALLSVNLVLGAMVFFNHLRSKSLTQDVLQQTSKVQGASSVPVFSPSFIMSDSTFSSTKAFPTQQSVQNYLNATGSPLRNYVDQGQPASYWIFQAARGNTSSKWNVRPQLNPGVLIAYLEKEQSLISLKNYDTKADPQNRIATAMGYGCPDGASCNPIYKGFANQLNWSAYQLQYNFNLAKGNSADLYKINKTITTLDSYQVFLSNAATAANYRYTPHVYWGNYNLWKIVTANAWGTSDQTYTYAEIDAVNLKNKPNPSSSEAAINVDQVASLIANEPQIGQTSDDIKLLQRFLKQRGHFTYPYITGYYGSITQTALRAYKSSTAPVPNAQNIAIPVDSNNCSLLYNKTYTIGQTSDEIKQLQTCLRNEGLFAWPVITGYYGSVTQQGLNTIRSRLGLNSTANNAATSTPAPAPTSTSTPAPTASQPVASSGQVYAVSKGVKTAGLNIRDAACGKIIGLVGWNVNGSVVSSPVTKNCFGSNLKWVQVRFNGGQTGWVSEQYISTEKENNYNLVVSNSMGEKVQFLNVRDKPCGKLIGNVGWGIQGTKTGEVEKKLCFGEKYNEWVKVNFVSGKSGWVSSYYLK